MTHASRIRFVLWLTVARFPLVLLFVAGALVFSRTGGFLLFLATMTALMVSAITDLLDGYFARRFEVVSRFGEYVDPLMDKLFYLSTLPVLIFAATKNGHMNHATLLLALTVFLLTRDQWVSFLRSIGSMYDASGAANWAGKLRTCVNLPVICAIYYYEEAPAGVQFLRGWLVHAMEGVAFLLNGISVYVYTRQYWPYLRDSAGATESAREGTPTGSRPVGFKKPDGQGSAAGIGS